jgi:hypothetical protein
MSSTFNAASEDQTNMATNADWEVVSHEDTAGYYTDRILLALGLRQVIHHLSITNVRNSSVLLMNTARLPPSDRHLRLPNLEHGMLNMYVTMDSSAPFAKEHSWSDIIKLAITAEILHDPIVSAHAIAALKKKEELVMGGEGELLSLEDYGIAWNFSRTGNGEWMLITLNQIRERQFRRLFAQSTLEAQTTSPAVPYDSAQAPLSSRDIQTSPAPPQAFVSFSPTPHITYHPALAPIAMPQATVANKHPFADRPSYRGGGRFSGHAHSTNLHYGQTPLAPSVSSPPPAWSHNPSQAPVPSSVVPNPQTVTDTATSNHSPLPDRPTYLPGQFSKYTNSTLRVKNLAPKEKLDESKWHASRQPVVPPSKEVLQTGTAGNFVWPSRR